MKRAIISMKDYFKKKLFIIKYMQEKHILELTSLNFITKWKSIQNLSYNKMVSENQLYKRGDKAPYQRQNAIFFSDIIELPSVPH